MLGIVFIILKSILLALLGLVLLLLILVNIILWVPIRYQVYGSKYDAILAYGKVDYLFGLIRVRFRYDGDGIRYVVKILWFKVHDSTAPSKNKKVVKKKTIKDTKKTYLNDQERIKEPDKSTEEKTEYVKDVVTEEKKEIKEIKESEIEAKDNKNKVAEAEAIKKEAIKDKENAKSLKAKKRKKDQKKKDGKSEPSVWEQIKSGIELLRSDKHKGVLKFVLGKVYKMIKSILPRHIEADIIFGFDDPATTGLVLGGVSMFYPCYGKTVVIIPNFEEVMFEGDIKIRGKIVIGVIVYYGLRVIIDKRVRSIIKAVR